MARQAREETGFACSAPVHRTDGRRASFIAFAAGSDHEYTVFHCFRQGFRFMLAPDIPIKVNSGEY
jgi:hypothetical protein